MKKYILLILLFISILTTVKSQQVVLEQDVKGDTLHSNFGQNRTHFRHLYLELNFVAPPDEKGAKLNYGSSNNLKIGMKYKLKICNYYAVGFDFYYLNQNFNISQDTNIKQVPNSTNHDKENIVINSFGAEFYNRINFRRRGDIIGKYFDYGIFGNISFDKKHKTIDSFNTLNSADALRQKVVNYKLGYVENFQYGVNARLGLNKFAFTASYRLSDIFKSSYNFPEFPRLNIGFQIGLF